MQPRGIQHVTVGVHDLAPAVEFYERLGFRRTDTRPDFSFDGAWMEAAEHQIHVVVTPGRTAPDSATHFAIIVDDLDSCLAELAEHGITGQRLTFHPNAGHQAFVTDPTGNVVELNQPLQPWVGAR
jgi:glyoxylase I family protein